MVFYEPIAVGLTQLRANKLRSSLTLLGIMIGVGAVIGIVSLGEGLRSTIAADFARQGGVTAIEVQPPRGWERKGGRWVHRAWREHLTSRDLEAFYEESDEIQVAVPDIERGVQLRYGKTTVSTQIKGTNEAFHEGMSWPASLGRQLTADDVKQARRVCLIGTWLWNDVFQQRDPLGEEIKLDGGRYTVVGVLEERVRFGREQGNLVLVPYTTVQRRLVGNQRIQEIVVFAEGIEAVGRVTEAVRRVLRRRHAHGEEFRVEAGQQELEQIDKVIGIMKMVAGGISGISLLVGGIGIMNIMLVSVTERTREIGIRKALGAKPGHILFQFLAEAIVLSLVGGLLGILLGSGFGFGMSQLIHQLDPNSPFYSVVAPDSVIWAMAFASAVGVFFGVYPAFRASRLDPVEALRYE